MLRAATYSWEAHNMMTPLAARQGRLRALVADGTLRMLWSAEVMERPAPFAGTSVAPDRVRGMLLGLAVGDALGNTSEGMRPYARRAELGEIRDYRANRHAMAPESGFHPMIHSLRSGPSSIFLSTGGSSQTSWRAYSARSASSASAARLAHSCMPGVKHGTGGARRSRRPATER